MLQSLSSKSEFHQKIERINQRQKANTFSSLMVQKIFGLKKSWKQLNKPQLAQMLETWEQMLAKCPETSNWKTVKVSDRLLSVTADRQRWVDYFGFASFTKAQEFLTEILPDCQWVLIRKSGQRLNVSIECKVWGLSPEKYQFLVQQEKDRSIPSMILVYNALNGGQYQTYIKSVNVDALETLKDLSNSDDRDRVRSAIGR